MTPANGQRGLRVDHILGRELRIQWTEAVALVGAACRQLVATGAPGFPVASQVVLYAEGAIAVLAASDHHPVRGAAQLLTSLIADDVPVRLRLMLTQATGMDGTYTTLKEFSDALAYFERPDPQQVLNALHDRALAAPSRGAVDSVPSPSVSVPARAPSSKEPRQARRTLRWVIGGTAVAVVLGLVWFLSPRLGELRVFAGVAAGSPAESASTTPAPEPGSSTVPALQESPSALPGSYKPSGQPSRDSNPGGPLSDPPLLELAIIDAAGAIPVIDLWAPPLFALPVDVNVLGQYAATDREGAVYSSTDPDVVPPHSVYPKLPSDRPGVPTDGRTVVDLLISADGRVEHVRLRTPPKTVHEFMLVSAAKAWQFDPAMINGRPVRFLHSVAITSPE